VNHKRWKRESGKPENCMGCGRRDLLRLVIRMMLVRSPVELTEEEIGGVVNEMILESVS